MPSLRDFGSSMHFALPSAFRPTNIRHAVSCGATTGDSLGLQSEVSGSNNQKVAERRQVLNTCRRSAACNACHGQFPRVETRGFHLSPLRGFQCVPWQSFLGLKPVENPRVSRAVASRLWEFNAFCFAVGVTAVNSAVDQNRGRPAASGQELAAGNFFEFGWGRFREYQVALVG